MTFSVFAERSPASSPVVEDTKLSPVSPVRPISTTEQKPLFRGFDITSLIRKDDDPPVRDSGRDSSHKPSQASPPASPNNNSSPTISKGPPIEKSSNPYAGLFSSSLYQQYLGHLLAGGGGAGGHPSPVPLPPTSAAFPPLHPMLLQAQLAMAAQQAGGPHPGLLALAGVGGIANPGYNSTQLASSVLAERLKQHRFNPYQRGGTVAGARPSHPSPPGPTSAFRALTPGSPPVSPPASHSPPASLDLSTSPAQPLSPPDSKSDIKNIENMIHGLNGSGDGRYGLSHDMKKLV